MGKKRKFKVGQNLWLIAAKNSKFVTEKIKITDVNKKKRIIANDEEYYRFEDFGVLFFDNKKEAKNAANNLAEKFQDNVVYQLNSKKKYERREVIRVESAIHEDSLYDVVIQLSGTWKKVSIKEIGKTIFIWDFKIGQRIFLLDYCGRPLGYNKLNVLLARITDVSVKKQTIKVNEHGKTRTYSFKDFNRLFFTDLDETLNAAKKFPSDINVKNFFRAPLYRIKWKKRKGVYDLWFYLTDGRVFPSTKIDDNRIK